MKRLLRLACDVATAVAAVLCVGTCVLWARSLRSAEIAHWAAWKAPGRSPLARIVWLGAVCGRLSVSYERLDFASPHMDPILRASTPPGFHLKSRELSFWQATGTSPLVIYGMERPFVLGSTRKKGPGLANVVYEAGSPSWFVACVTAVLPLLWAGRFVARWSGRRRNRTACRRCGYDLRATPAAARSVGSVEGG